MFGIETLEIVIGLVFVYLLFSILLTLLIEYISSIAKLRAKNLKVIIERALDDDGQNTFSSKFYSHPLIKYLGKKNGKLPSYIGSDKFAKTVLDLIRTKANLSELGNTSSLDKQRISEAIEDIGQILGTDTKNLLMSFAKESEEDINEFGKRLEAWFNETVERGEGWFNRRIKAITIITSFVVVVALNVDSIRVYRQLSANSDLRTQIADGASNYMSKNETTLESPKTTYDSARIALNDFYSKDLQTNTNMLSIGWDESARDYFSTECNWVLSFLGWIISACAISLGAPFWFGVLNKLVALRSAGKQKEQSEKRLESQINKPKPVG